MVNGTVQKGQRWLYAAIIVSSLIILIYYNSHQQQWWVTSLHYAAPCHCLQPRAGCEQICQQESNKNLKLERDNQDKTADVNNLEIKQASNATRFAQNPAETEINAHPMTDSKPSESQKVHTMKLPSTKDIKLKT